MPELPEVQTTVNGLNRTVRGRRIVSVSTTYGSSYHAGKDNIKNPEFFKSFKKIVAGQKILKAERRAKNILIRLSNGYTILVHMKMTGHFVYDQPRYPFTRLDITLNNDKHLVLSDMRKFAKVTVVKSPEEYLAHLGPEPLEKNFQFKIFNFQLMKRPKAKIKTTLLDQTLIAGIGNIYSDEILWRANVHPESRVAKIPNENIRLMFKAMKEVLRAGINFGGDSMSDYRNIKGERGKFQEHHKAYQQTDKKCQKNSCSGIIKRIIVGARSAHFCPIHQKLYV